ncbi:MAG: NTP transferase domain-containing protein [Verrucomicrobiales bacterium]|nr:NTP transferase domain-containing protein [Verrucomicrobiales bacterium]
MAGLSQRFTDAGFTQPKYMLPYRGRTLFAHVVNGFRAYFEHERFVFVFRDVSDTVTFIRTELEGLGLNPGLVDLVRMDQTTRGQAETVAIALRTIRGIDDEPLSIFNIDTIRPDFKHPESLDLSKIDGYLEVFHGDGDHWSFVLPDKTDPHLKRAVQVTEKRKVSDLCCTGLYFFRTVSLFLKAFARIEHKSAEDQEGGEFYVAPLFQDLIDRGKNIHYTLISKNEVSFSGTPEEYYRLLKS